MFAQTGFLIALCLLSWPCPAENLSAYAGQPEFQFTRDTPATRDETRVLGGTPGEYATIARRHGKEWFLGSLSNWRPRELDLSLDFLPRGNYQSKIYTDGDHADQQPTSVCVERKMVDRTQHLVAKLAGGGGYAVRFKPVP